jgi:hypothetical protein
MRRRPRGVAGVLTLLVASVALTGCGAGNSGTGADASLDPEDARLAYARCMRENGVDIPDPKPGTNGMVQLAPGTGPGVGVDGETFESARKACAKYAEDMGGPGAAGFGEADKERLLQFARCMREHGVDVPDPDLDEDGGIAVEVPRGGVDADFDAAHKGCQKYFGSAGDGS